MGELEPGLAEAPRWISTAAQESSFLLTLTFMDRPASVDEVVASMVPAHAELFQRTLHNDRLARLGEHGFTRTLLTWNDSNRNLVERAKDDANKYRITETGREYLGALLKAHCAKPVYTPYVAEVINHHFPA